jgi:Zn-finger protein
MLSTVVLTISTTGHHDSIQAIAEADSSTECVLLHTEMSADIVLDSVLNLMEVVDTQATHTVQAWATAQVATTIVQVVM